jgi:EpsI family protein
MAVTASLPTSLEPSPVIVQPSAPKGTVPLWRSGFIFGLAVVMLAATWINPPLNLPQQAGIVMALPGVVDIPVPGRAGAQFYGAQAAITDGELGTLPSDTELLRKQYDDFRSHESILCTLLLSGAEQRSIHRAEVCLPGQGWTITGQGDLPVPLASGHDLIVRELTIQRDTVSQNGEHHMVHALFMYWFVGENTTTASQFMRVFLSSWDRIFHNRAHRWAYIMVTSPVTDSFRPDGLNADQTQAMLTNFIRQAVPSFQKNEMPAQAAH